MGLSNRIAELFFKGALASYLLLYALDFKTSTDRWNTLISSNINVYANYIGIAIGDPTVLVQKWLSSYSQWLVVVGLMIVATNFRTGAVLGWFTILINLLLCWNPTEWLFIGT